MSKKTDAKGSDYGREASKSRPVRADAQRNIDALLEAALAVFATSGVDAPVREIAEKAGVGIGTVYRHFPQRSDLIVAVFRHQVDACADAASVLAAKHPPGEALALWMQRYADFIATKRGLATALHSGNPAFNTLPIYFDKRLRPALQALLNAAASAGEVRTDIEPDDLLRAVASLCMSADGDRTDYVRRMVALLVDGLRYTANPSVNTPPERESVGSDLDTASIDESDRL
ncbi:TetR/AcrR family transcriptional regulator [Leptolyngbya sp. NIES-2104]|uniref:TetR/AcrR family transcriptional regulator n=1 Tax=Leptolyngbya sp. NIES-2104 TaxID=1552121 RepID=UPI0006EC4478|nr:TetR/AcrR family transcriptional regulator [Leptolyngbya sp. NIES-2104]GAP96818.1 transcriptional regulator, TetR family [Leptolyngbya sp. NIES-2104]